MHAKWEYRLKALFFSYRSTLPDTGTHSRNCLQDMTAASMTRQQELAQWVQLHLMPDADRSTTVLQLLPVGGDAGFRNYFRIQTPQGSVLAVDAPPETEDSRAFVRIAGEMASVGIKVPEVRAVDYQRGYLLIEDFGDHLLLNQLDRHSVDSHYAEALALLTTIQSTPLDHLPLYDTAMLEMELSLFPDWFLKQLIEIDLTEQMKSCSEA